MTRAPLQRRGTALVGLAVMSSLVLSLVACSRPGRDRAAPPTAAPSPAAPAPVLPTPQQSRQRLQAALLSADDQFNRGENDLACEQVQRAQRLLGQRPEAASATQREQLLRFERACSTL